MFERIKRKIKPTVRKVDKEIPFRVKRIDDHIPKPIGILLENCQYYRCENITTVGIPSPIVDIGGRFGIIRNIRAY
ncbi:hypothetical protein [Archaeoglobus profundus]|uniref:Uncharacterized protein n=1 Tax=Archaeoglobus profundus (strain DSM 5631 / JCM 9629 / NBRC 100127 / Av18) TaxID=572546 RepID=D2REV5_ARCPA|nr:hypothetical protein [Archaeoglobus profundus]ADB58649.1 hypothetical protein Arcpr_1603 [Archaeoglobus profundus DSM 5631]